MTFYDLIFSYIKRIKYIYNYMSNIGSKKSFMSYKIYSVKNYSLATLDFINNNEIIYKSKTKLCKELQKKYIDV